MTTNAEINLKLDLILSELASLRKDLKTSRQGSFVVNKMCEERNCNHVATLNSNYCYDHKCHVYTCTEYHKTCMEHRTE